MSSRTAGKGARTAAGQRPRRPTPTKAATRTRSRWRLAAAVVAAVLAVGGLYAVYRNATNPDPGGGSSGTGASGYSFQVGTPGPGAQAPTFALESTAGGRLDLASLRGKNVLLYFQEGLMCQPCWDQITDLEKRAADLKTTGIEQVVSITTDPLNLITRKTRDMGLTTPVLSDPDLAVSKAYDANSYGMMGDSRDGHTFILVDPDGVIRWRADYGGAPKYHMFIPVDALLTDLRAGTQAGQP